MKAVSTIISKTEEKERDAKRNANNMTVDNFIQSPVTTNVPINKSNNPNEKRISSDSLAEMIKVFIILTLQSKLNESGNKITPKVIQKAIH